VSVAPAASEASAEPALPAGAALFAKHARNHGWHVRTAITSGHVPYRTSGETVRVEMAGVWLDGHGLRVYAMWERRPEGAPSAQAWKWSNAGARPHGTKAWRPLRTMALAKAFLMAKGWSQ
jgi:hypothetical protein